MMRIQENIVYNFIDAPETVIGLCIRETGIKVYAGTPRGSKLISTNRYSGEDPK